MLRKGLIVVMDEKVTILKNGKKVQKVVGPQDEKVRLRWFDAKRAVTIVKATYNRDLLNRWLDEETRGPVKKALTAQLEPLLNKEDEDTGRAASDDEDEDLDDEQSA